MPDTATTARRVLIAGGGIGGLTAAIVLRRAGHDVWVYEQASELRAVGAGIQLSPNVVKVLHGLGLAESLAKAAVAPLSVDSRAWDSGDVIGRVTLGDRCLTDYGAPYYHMHRADLHAVLIAALGPEAVVLSARCTGFEQDGDGVSALFEDGRRERGDALIGADGIHSAVRTALFGAEQPHFSGKVAWRGLAPAERVADLGFERRGASFWGPNKNFVCYFVSGGRLINWVGVVPSQSWRHESWSTRGERAEAAVEFSGWHPQVTGLIAATDQPYKWALYDRDPLPAWSHGRVTLLGDAAHPMLPFLAQGAAQSIEDGYVLGRCLDTFDDVPRALTEYEARRKDRATRAQAGSRQAGQTMHLSDPEDRRLRDERIRADPEANMRSYDWLYGHDVESAMSLTHTAP